MYVVSNQSCFCLSLLKASIIYKEMLCLAYLLFRGVTTGFSALALLTSWARSLYININFGNPSYIEG